jgi:hypothetical protein
MALHPRNLASIPPTTGPMAGAILAAISRLDLQSIVYQRS